MDPVVALAILKDALRKPVDSGGYAKTIWLSGGYCICHSCARENWREIVQATLNHDMWGGWCAAGVEIMWEGPPEHCSQCSVEMPTEYGETSAEPGEEREWNERRSKEK